LLEEKTEQRTGRLFVSNKERAMRVLAIIGALLIVFGIVALAFQGFTFFTTERMVDAGPLHIDVQKPHTIIFHPILGVVAVVAGLVLVIVGIKGKTV
jgi:drug/metabolite transporter (DMT)-like permease